MGASGALAIADALRINTSIAHLVVDLHKVGKEEVYPKKTYTRRHELTHLFLLFCSFLSSFLGSYNRKCYSC